MTFNLSVKDVYDFAVEIATDFDKLCEIFEAGKITHLINKVINVLECLEASVKQIELYEKELADLKLKNDQLSREKLVHEEGKWKLEQDFEEIEKAWEGEIVHLKSIINKLQDKIQQLQHVLDDREVFSAQRENDDIVVIHDQENVITKLKTCLQSREGQLQKCAHDIESLNCKVEQLCDANRSLRIDYHRAKKEIQQLHEKMSQDKLDCHKQLVFGIEQKSTEVLKDEFFSGCVVSETEFKNKVDCNTSAQDTIDVLQHEKYDLQVEVHRLEQELISSKKQAQYYKEKFQQSTKEQNQCNFQRSSGIRQLFHLFLGVVSFKPRLHM